MRITIGRGIEIYKNLIGNDEIVIVIEEWEDEWFDPYTLNKGHLYNILNGTKLRRIPGPFEQFYYDIDNDGNKTEKLATEKKECDLIIERTKLSIEQVKSIIKGIASLEMGKEPSIPQSVYFFSIKKQAGFSIYDDRGCDIWANSIETLRPTYKKLNS